MSGQYLNAITENASRLGMRLQESFSEHTRDLALNTSSAAYLNVADDKSKDIKRQLDSNSDREKLDAMKRLIALMSKGRNVSEYFAQVVKNVASHNLEIRKLVYIYLLRYAEQEPDLALLSINTFQKDLADSSPLIRAMALRVLSGIRVPIIGSIVVLAIKKCAADMSPYVRKTASLSIPKCYTLDSTHLPALIAIITTLLRDSSPVSIGSVAVAFQSVCPTRLDLIHPHFRRLCKILGDVDEWGQIDLSELLLRYARTMLPRPSVSTDGDGVDSDLKLLLSSVNPLLQSRNPAVVAAAIRVIYYAGLPTDLPKVVQPLLRLLSISKEVERVALVYIRIICKAAPSLFVPFVPRVLVRSDDTSQVKLDKVQILLVLLTLETYQFILRELVDYCDDPDPEVVASAVHGVGKCARTIPESTQTCLAALISMIKSARDAVVSSAVVVLKHLVQKQLSASGMTILEGAQPMTIISQLAHKIDDIKHAHARACVLWLVGQYAPSSEPSVGPDGMSDWAPDVLRRAAKEFTQQDNVVKLQTITLAAKLTILNSTDTKLTLLSRYVFSLARYDSNYDVRDRARMLSSLLSGVVSTSLGDTDVDNKGGVTLRREQVRMVLFEGKTGTSEENATSDDEKALICSLSAVTQRTMRLDVLPDWLEKGVESSLRDTDEAASVAVAPLALSSSTARNIPFNSPIVLTPTGASSPAPGSGSGYGGRNDLDKFYEDNEDEDTEGSEEEDDEEDSENEAEEAPSAGEEEQQEEEDEDGDSESGGVSDLAERDGDSLDTSSQHRMTPKE